MNIKKVASCILVVVLLFAITIVALSMENDYYYVEVQNQNIQYDEYLQEGIKLIVDGREIIVCDPETAAYFTAYLNIRSYMNSGYILRRQPIMYPDGSMGDFEVFVRRPDGSLIPIHSEEISPYWVEYAKLVGWLE